MSPVRKQYTARLIGRCLVLAVCFLLFFFRPQTFEILDGMNFFSGPSVLHLLWIIWVIDMVLQIIPIKNKVALGSQKLFLHRFRPLPKEINYKVLKTYAASTAHAAYKVMVLWVLLIAVIGVLYGTGIIGNQVLFLISVVFYVCDLICVLIWCPFRLIMKNKCCTTCRIFNWDHLMMFSPLVFAGGFYALSLVCMAVLAFLIWEICTILYPERFSEMTNAALRCSECTDKLCTQYCQKLR